MARTVVLSGCALWLACILLLEKLNRGASFLSTNPSTRHPQQPLLHAFEPSSLLDKLPKIIKNPFSGDNEPSPDQLGKVESPIISLGPFDPSPEGLIERAKYVLSADLGIKDPNILDSEFVWIGPTLEKGLNKVEYLAAGKFFNLRGAFPDLDYRGHDYRLDTEDVATIRLTARPVGTMRGPLRLRKEILPANGKRLRGPPEAMSITFDLETGKVLKICSGFCMDRLQGNTQGLCGVMAASVVAGLPPSEWEVYPVPVVLSRFLGRPVKQIKEPTTFLAPFPETVMIQLAKGILAAELGSDDPTLLKKDFQYYTPIVGPIGKDEFVESYAKLEFGGFEPKVSNFRVDPYDPYRVWVDVNPVGPGFEGPPQAYSFSFDDDGFCTRITAGAVMDPSIGNCGGLAGENGRKYAAGSPPSDFLVRPLPLALGRLRKALFFVITKLGVDDYVPETSKIRKLVRRGVASAETPPPPPTIVEESAPNAPETPALKLPTPPSVPAIPKPSVPLPVPKIAGPPSEPNKEADRQRILQEAKKKIQQEEERKARAVQEREEKLKAQKEAAAAKRQVEAEKAKERQQAALEMQKEKQAKLQEERAIAEAKRKEDAARRAEESRAALARVKEEQAKRLAEREEKKKQLAKKESERKAAIREAKASEPRPSLRLIDLVPSDPPTPKESSNKRPSLRIADLLGEQTSTVDKKPPSPPEKRPSLQIPGLFSDTASKSPPPKVEKRPSLQIPGLFPEKPQAPPKVEKRPSFQIPGLNRAGGSTDEAQMARKKKAEDDKRKKAEEAKARREQQEKIKAEAIQRRQEAQAKRAAAMEQAKQAKAAKLEAAARERAAKLEAAAREKAAKEAAAKERAAKLQAAPSAPRKSFSLFQKVEQPPSAPAPVAKAPKGVPTIVSWKKRGDGGVSGLVFGSPNFRDGERIETSPIVSSAVDNGQVVVTDSGSKYFLSSATVRDMKKQTPKKEQLQQLASAKSGATIRLTSEARQKEVEAAQQALKKAKSQSTFSLTSLFGSSSEESSPPPSKPTKAKKVVATTAPRGVPTISRWRQNRDKSITGFITGSPLFTDGEKVTTSPIAKGNVGKGEVVTTGSGSRYFLQ